MTFLKRNTLSFIVLILYVLSSGSFFAVNAQQKAFTFEYKSQGSMHTFKYLLFLPKDYNEKVSRKFPLIFSHHGAGGNGDNIELLKRHGPQKVALKKSDFQFIVLSPQVPINPDFDLVAEAWMALLDEILKDYPVDSKRVYITGYSQGGFLTWVLSMNHPETFAAVVPIAGGGDLAMLCEAMKNMKIPCKHASRNTEPVCNLKNIPVRVFHGDRDPVVPPYASKALVDQLLSCNGNVQFTLYPGVGHDSWTRTYNNPELYDWLLSNSLEK